MVELCIKNAMKFLKIGELKKFCQKLQCKKVAINKKGCNKVAKIKDIAAKVTITLQNVAKSCEMEWITETSKKANFISCKMNWVAKTSKKANFMGCGNFQKKANFK